MKIMHIINLYNLEKKEAKNPVGLPTFFYILNTPVISGNPGG